MRGAVQGLHRFSRCDGFRASTSGISSGGAETAQTADWPDLVDATAGAADFADTARELAACDLLISVDTAAVHLAGALGVPAWVLVPDVPDWRWGATGATTPWYPRATVVAAGLSAAVGTSFSIASPRR